MVRVDFVRSLIMTFFFREVSYARWLRNPDGIARRVPGVWVLPFPTYFNICLFTYVVSCNQTIIFYAKPPVMETIHHYQHYQISKNCFVQNVYLLPMNIFINSVWSNPFTCRINCF